VEIVCTTVSKVAYTFPRNFSTATTPATIPGRAVPPLGELSSKFK